VALLQIFPGEGPGGAGWGNGGIESMTASSTSQVQACWGSKQARSQNKRGEKKDAITRPVKDSLRGCTWEALRRTRRLTRKSLKEEERSSKDTSRREGEKKKGGKIQVCSRETKPPAATGKKVIFKGGRRKKKWEKRDTENESNQYGEVEKTDAVSSEGLL